MHRANAEYADRVSNILSNAIGKLSMRSDDSAETFGCVRSTKNDELCRLLEKLCTMRKSALFQDESLRSDIHKYECEQRTKNNELSRFQTKLCTMRQAREDRRAELDKELSLLRAQFNEMQHRMAKEQELVEQGELSDLSNQQTLFEKEVEAMMQEKQVLLKQLADSNYSFTEQESSIRSNISRLMFDIQKLSCDHDAASKTKLSDIDSIRAHLEQQRMQQRKLEKHFKMVDLNNAMKQHEEEQLRKIAELDDMATSLLGNGAIALQKVWRGSKDRKLVATIKSKQAKKSGKSKKKK